MVMCFDGWRCGAARRSGVIVRDYIDGRRQFGCVDGVDEKRDLDTKKFILEDIGASSQDNYSIFGTDSVTAVWLNG